MSLARTFSFDGDDERALSSNANERLDYHLQRSQYRETPDRDIISPPPQYSSPPPIEPVSPIAPTTHSHFPPRIPSIQSPVHLRRISDVPVRRPVPSPSSETPPPPPPPHRTSPTRVGIYQDQNAGLPRYSPPGNSRATPDRPSSNESNEVPGRGRIPYEMEVRNRRDSRTLSSSPVRDFSPYREDGHSETITPQKRVDRFPDRYSHNSSMPLTAGAASPGTITPIRTPDLRHTRYSGQTIPLGDYPMSQFTTSGNYHDSPYLNSSLDHNPAISEASINPYNIADDGDDGFIPDPRRKTMMERVTQRQNTGGSQEYPPPAKSGPLGALSGIFGRRAKNQTSSGSYNAVQQGGIPGIFEKGQKSEWLSRQTKGNNKMRWIVGSAIIGVIVLAIVAGTIGGVINAKKSSSSSSGDNGSGTAAGDTAKNGDLGINSAEIQALLNNPDLHKVFPGIDYTPWGTQYPLCFTYPPSQNNVTRDMAVLSQLTNTVRLYGTDCNQTEMVLHSIQRLELTDMKVWLGVWLDTNQTTNDRQLAQMYKILSETEDLSIFKGAIIGNEALFRAGIDKSQSELELINILTEVKANFTQLGYDMPVATSDLGDNWNSQLVEAVDIVMSNIHPFFAGVTAAEAAAWTLEFWHNKDLPLTTQVPGETSKRQIISETGWPSDGGMDCGITSETCATGQVGALAGVDGMNTFMNDWVCQALENGTEYFWFEAFDEPWKIVYNTPGKEWEDKWGLMDPGRNLKTGLVIPDCGGKTVT